MYLRVNEQRYHAIYNEGDEIMLSYDKSIKNNGIVINQYVCLFDDDYSVIEEVFSFFGKQTTCQTLGF